MHTTPTAWGYTLIYNLASHVHLQGESPALWFQHRKYKGCLKSYAEVFWDPWVMQGSGFIELLFCYLDSSDQV